MSTIRNLALGAGLAACLLLGGAPPARAQEGGQQQAQPQERIARLIAELGHDDFQVRERAQRELERIGRPAAGALEQATKSEDPEVAARAGEALARIRGARPAEPGRPRDELRGQDQPGAPQLPPTPDMDEALRELQRQLPELERLQEELRRQLPGEFQDLFRDMFGESPFGQREDGTRPRDEERGGEARPRVRVWTWNNRQSEAVDSTFGLQVGSPSAALRAQLAIPGNEGLVINGVLADGWAARSGLELYDVVVALDDRPVRGLEDLRPLLQKPCKVTFYRRARLQTAELPAVGRGATTPRPQPGQPAQPEQPEQPRRTRSF